MNDYVHGYSEYESARLDDQAQVLRRLLHGDVIFPEGSTVLEAGCGTGAQTLILADNNPTSHFVSVDLSGDSLKEAAAAVAAHGYTNVEMEQQDIYDLSYPDNYFDHLFCCFVLEHLADPRLAGGTPSSSANNLAQSDRPQPSHAGAPRLPKGSATRTRSAKETPPDHPDELPGTSFCE